MLNLRAMEELTTRNGGVVFNKRGEGSEQTQEGGPSSAGHSNDPLKKSLSKNDGNVPSEYEDPSSNQALGTALFSDTEPLNNSPYVLKGTAGFLEHMSPSHNLFQSSLHDQHPELPASDLNLFTVCGSLPPPTYAERAFVKFSGIFPVGLEDRGKPAQGIMGEVSGGTQSKGRRGRGQGRGRGRGRSEQSQDAITGPVTDSTSTHDSLSLLEQSNKGGSSNKRGSSIRGQSARGRGKGRASSGQKAFLDQEQSAPLHAAAPGATVVGLNTTIGACGALLPAQYTVAGLCETSPFEVEEQRRQGNLGHQFVRIDEVTTSTLTSREWSSSRGGGGRERGRGRGRGGRGRGRSGEGEDQKGVSMSSEIGKTLKGKGPLKQGKGKRSSQRSTISNHEITAPTPSKDVPTDRMEFSFSTLNSVEGVINIEKGHEPLHSSAEVRSSSIHLEEGSLGPPPCTGGLAPRDVEDQGRLDYREPPLNPSSLKGGTLHLEMADFLMSAGVESVRGQPSKSARKRTKSRKVLENENLWRELTAAHELTAAPNVVDSTIDPIVNCSTSEHSQAQSTLPAEKINIIQFNKVNTLYDASIAETGEASTVDTGIQESMKSGKKTKRQPSLKERARFHERPSPQDLGDSFSCLHQASDVDLRAAHEHGSYSRFSAEIDSAHAEAEFSDFDSIDVVEDWQSYCPYTPSSPNLINVYEDGVPKVTSLPIFGSSRVSPCTTKTWPGYYDIVLNAGGSIWAMDWCPHRIPPDDSRREFLAIGAHPHDSPTHRFGEPVQGKGLIQLWAFDLPFLSQAQASWQYHHLNKQGQGKQKGRCTGKARGRPKKLTLEDKESRELYVGDVAQSGFNLEKSPILLLEEGKLHARTGMEVDCEKLESSVPALTSSVVEEFDLPQMVMGLAHDAGLVWDAKWQPVNALYSSSSGRLGYLAAVFGDGSMQVYDIPLPSLLRKVKSCTNNSAPLIVKMKPVLKCSGLSSSEQKSLPLTIEWSSSPLHDLLLVGCHDGAVALWRFNPNDLRDHEARPLTCFVADTAPIRALSFAPDGTDVESRNVAVTGGHSGRLLFWDLRDPFYPLWDLSLSKGGCILSIDWPLCPRGIILAMDDGTIRTLSLDAALCDAPLTGTPPPKSLSQGMHTTFTSEYAVWSVHVSRASGVALYAGEDGLVVYCQLTEKYFVNDRARAREPHFLCCKLRENSVSGLLTIESVNFDAPLQVKNQRADSKQVPLTKAFSRRASGGMCEEEEGQKKKSDTGVAKKRKLSLLEGRETDDEDFSPDEVDPLALVPYDPNMCVKAKGKSRSMSRKVTKDNSRNCGASKQGMLCESSGTIAGAVHNGGESIEQPPSKAVAVHRVRWNQNKGCESLVCFGGAAGIIRCQLITPRGL